MPGAFTPKAPIVESRKKIFPIVDAALHLESMRTFVFDTVIQRLETECIPTSRLDKEQLHFALPITASEDWKTLLQAPILLSEEALSKIMSITDNTIAHSRCPPDHSVFYLRSFSLTVSQLESICSYWREQDKNHAEVAVWSIMTESLTDKTTLVYIRYIGYSRVNSGAKRHKDDAAKREHGLFRHFLDACEVVCPSVKPRIFHFNDAELAPSHLQNNASSLTCSEIGDLRERVLIALFGLPSLLNRQSGGHYAVYQPSESDVATFRKLRTSTFAKLVDTANQQQPTASLRRDVTTWMDKIIQFASRNSEELELGVVSPIGDRHRKAWVNQALPTRVFGRTLMVTVSDDIPLHALDNPQTFWLQKARSAKMAKDYLSRLMAYEQGSTEWQHSQLEPVINAGLLPFIDHRYWPNVTSLCEESIALTRSYFETTQPWLALVMAGKGNLFVRRNFVGASAAAITDLLGELRNFTIQYYTDPGEYVYPPNKPATASRPADPEHAFIQMPTFHPGAEKYGTGSVALRRVININFWKVDLAMEVTMDLWYRIENDATLRLSRYDTCQLILKQIERRWQASGADIVFDQAKQDLRDEWAKFSGAAKTNNQNRWKNDPTRKFTSSVNGATVNVDNEGKMIMYWKRNDGSEQRVSLTGGLNMVPKSGEPKTRIVVFNAGGIDIQDHSGNSMTYICYSRPSSNPTFPGSVLQDKLERKAPDAQAAIDLWEHEMGLSFNFSSKDRPMPDCTPCKRSNSLCSGGRPCTRCRERGILCATGVPKLPPVNQALITSLFQPQTSSQGRITLPVSSRDGQLGPSAAKRVKLSAVETHKRTPLKKAQPSFAKSLTQNKIILPPAPSLPGSTFTALVPPPPTSIQTAVAPLVPDPSVQNTLRQNIPGPPIVFDNKGKITITWQKSGGRVMVFTMTAGNKLGLVSAQSRTRTMFFGPDSIDIRDASGASLTYSAQRCYSKNPTFPGSVLQGKLDRNEVDINKVIEMWEHETNLIFDGSFSVYERPGASCARCHKHKYKCDGARPCSKCADKGHTCVNQS
ncbi:hypothetical protein D6D05_09733 [Aureobasidium pullulans]|nr:hypothetical protein D6D05_09733 [Aureobasidium pullulans]